jgi:hypothetical protein
MSDEGGFDYRAYQQSKSDPDKALIVTFEYAAVKQVNGSFKNVEMIRIWLGRNDEIVRPVQEADKIRFATRYEAFKKGEQVPEDGTPISQCAFATPADVSACKAERIFTLEQLVETPDERIARAKLITFKYRCRDWLESQKRHGYVGELRSRIELLEKENALLKERLRADGKDTEVVVPVAKKRGRPRVEHGENTAATG